MKSALIVLFSVILNINIEAQDSTGSISGDTLENPNYVLLSAIKLKCDSIVKSIYGEMFFYKHIKWSQHSYYFYIHSGDGAFPHEWQDNERNRYVPGTEFNLRYDILYDYGVLKEGIMIIIDKDGHLLQNHRWMYNGDRIYNQGFEKIDSSIHDFMLTSREAIQLARKYKLHEKDSSRISCELKWHQIKDSSSKIYNGNFYFEVIYDPNFSRRKRRRFLRGDKFKVYYHHWLFNPWTGVFVKKYTLHHYVNEYKIF